MNLENIWPVAIKARLGWPGRCPGLKVRVHAGEIWVFRNGRVYALLPLWGTVCFAIGVLFGSYLAGMVWWSLMRNSGQAPVPRATVVARASLTLSCVGEVPLSSSLGLGARVGLDGRARAGARPASTTRRIELAVFTSRSNRPGSKGFVVPFHPVQFSSARPDGRDRRPMSTQCRDCHAELVWAETAELRKPMPLDVTPKFNVGDIPPKIFSGLFVLDPQNGKLIATALVAVPDAITPATVKREIYASHFATCPHAANFRSKRHARGSTEKRGRSPRANSRDHG